MNFKKLKKYGFYLNENDDLVDFNQVITDELNPLLFCLRNNINFNLNYDKMHLNYLIEKSNLLHLDNNFENVLHYISQHNLLQNLNFNRQEIMDIVRKYPQLLCNNDLAKKYNKMNNLMFFILDNKFENLHLTEADFFEIININLEQINDKSRNVFVLAVSKKENYSFNFLNYLYENIGVSQEKYEELQKNNLLKEKFNNFLEERKIFLEKNKLNKEIKNPKKNINKGILKI